MSVFVPVSLAALGLVVFFLWRMRPVVSLEAIKQDLDDIPPNFWGWSGHLLYDDQGRSIGQHLKQGGVSMICIPEEGKMRLVLRRFFFQGTLTLVFEGEVPVRMSLDVPTEHDVPLTDLPYASFLLEEAQRRL